MEITIIDIAIAIIDIAIVVYLLVGAMFFRGRRAKAMLAGRGKGTSFCLVVVWMLVWPAVLLWRR